LEILAWPGSTFIEKSSIPPVLEMQDEFFGPINEAKLTGKEKQRKHSIQKNTV